MEKIPCYLYKEDLDFSLPEEYREAYGYLPEESFECVLRDENGKPRLHPDYFIETSPENAELFIFPHDLNRMINLFHSGRTTLFLKNLPYLSGREARHVFSDTGDFAQCVDLPVCLLKRSVIAPGSGHYPGLPFVYKNAGLNSPNCIVTWYDLPKHVEEDKPSFAWGGLRYDSSFVGAYTNITRNMACKAAEREEGLRFYSGGFEKVTTEKEFFRFAELTPEEERARERTFREVTKASLTVLCPPGVGPQSFRMYECMYYGRIPVLFLDKIRYPLEHLITYEDFCLFIDEKDIMLTGKVILDFIRSHTLDELHQKCVLACKTWNKYFRRQDRVGRLAALLREYKDALPGA